MLFEKKWYSRNANDWGFAAVYVFPLYICVSVLYIPYLINTTEWDKYIVLMSFSIAAELLFFCMWLLNLKDELAVLRLLGGPRVIKKNIIPNLEYDKDGGLVKVVVDGVSYDKKNQINNLCENYRGRSVVVYNLTGDSRAYILVIELRQRQNIVEIFEILPFEL